MTKKYIYSDSYCKCGHFKCEHNDFGDCNEYINIGLGGTSKCGCIKFELKCGCIKFELDEEKD